MKIVAFTGWRELFAEGEFEKRKIKEIALKYS